MRKILRRIHVLVRGSLAAMFFLSEFVYFWLSFHVYLRRARQRAEENYRELGLITRDKALHQDLKLVTARWGMNYSAHTVWWSQKVLGYKFEYDVPRKLPRSLIIVVRHTSSMDIPWVLTICKHINRPITWIAKKQAGSWPSLGLALYLLDSALVKRDHSLQDKIRVWVCARKALRSGISILIFPSGSRSSSKTQGGGFNAACSVFDEYADSPEDIGVLTLDIRGLHRHLIKTIFRTGDLAGKTVTVIGKLDMDVISLPKADRIAWLKRTQAEQGK